MDAHRLRSRDPDRHRAGGHDPADTGTGFPQHYFLVAIGAPGAALPLSVWYARKRDSLDRKYGSIGYDRAS